MNIIGRLSILVALFQIISALPLYSYEIADAGHSIRTPDLEQIEGIVERQIQAGNIPGAVILIGKDGKIVYRRAFGYRAVEPERLPMVEDTVFDVASLTKVVATTTAVMQLVEKGKLNLDAPVSRYWRQFASKGKKGITVRQLLSHQSGLRADLDLKPKWAGYRKAMRLVVAEKPVIPPGSGYIYSDINFEALGELVRRASGMPLDRYSEKKIFKPLGMQESAFKVSAALRKRIAPTEFALGEVHDPTAQRMGGIAGHAGLFSTADDLAKFAQMLLDGGSSKGTRILKAGTIEEMTKPQILKGNGVLRGLGWKIASPAHQEDLFPVGSYGHTGYTGTSIWIDPVAKSYVIILTNRVHPRGQGDVAPLRAEMAALVTQGRVEEKVKEDQPLSSPGPLSIEASKVQTGVDVLANEGFAPLFGLRVGLITNHSGLDSNGRHTIDLLYKAPGVKLTAIFSPEHGLYGNLDDKVASGVEPSTKLPVYSLYGDVRRPKEEMLDGLDALVFDIQDAGARFYTYISTMAYAMEAASRKGIDFYVLDRPNPINASVVQGPVMDQDLKSFTGIFPLPVRHGMTIGELAQMFNSENKIGAKLHVIRMRDYKRRSWFDETGLKWTNPSPNLRNLLETTLYPGVALVEGANVSVGRGTDTPFELLGAPWIKGKALADYLNKRNIRGVHFEPAVFKPSDSCYKDRQCQGIRIVLKDREALDAPALGLEIVSALRKLYPRDFQVENTLGMIGARSVLQSIKEGKDPRALSSKWQDNLEAFLNLRSGYLLY